MKPFKTLFAVLALAAAASAHPSVRGDRKFIDGDKDLNGLVTSRQSEGGGSEEICMDKVVMMEQTVYDDEVRCSHIYTKECSEVFETDFVPTVVEKCEEIFHKHCHIEIVEDPRTHEVEVCEQNMVRDCDQEGEETCTDEYETVCETEYQQGTVKEEIPICETKKVEVCNTDDAGVEKCYMAPQQNCELMVMDSRKVMPNTACKQVKTQVCGPEICPIVPGEKRCRMTRKTVIVEEPRENCNMNPQTRCNNETTLVPKMVARESCQDIPKEICTNHKVNPRKKRTPTIKKWCGPAELVNNVQTNSEEEAPQDTLFVRDSQNDAIVTQVKHQEEETFENVAGPFAQLWKDQEALENFLGNFHQAQGRNGAAEIEAEVAPEEPIVALEPADELSMEDMPKSRSAKMGRRRSKMGVY